MGFNAPQFNRPIPLVRSSGNLPDAVGSAFGFSRCPCCDRVMNSSSVKKYRSTPTDKKTVGHDVAVARGGHPGAWFWMCHRCNNDQGVLDLVTWARKLVYGDDPRAARVVEVSKFVRGWVAAWLEEQA